ncbi:MAG: hypothetical protein NXI04_25125 [Planctomycetaceae bacterium]|nr:hypothetical protein [Planctomycetaceae bacterium]
MKKILTFIAVVMMTGPVFAHRSHTSVAEVEWNAQSQVFEVAMRLHIADLEDAISVRNKKKFRIESTDNAEQQIQAYLQNRFQIRSDVNVFAKLNWVGMELELHDAWVYFEVSQAKPAPATGASSSPPAAPAASDSRVQKWEDLFTKPSQPGAAANPSPGRMEVTNTVLFDVQPEQKNVVSFTQNRRTLSVVLLPQRPTGGLMSRLQPPAPGWQRKR